MKSFEGDTPAIRKMLQSNYDIITKTRLAILRIFSILPFSFEASKFVALKTATFLWIFNFCYVVNELKEGGKKFFFKNFFIRFKNRLGNAP